MLTVNRERFFAAPALRVKVCTCMGSGDVWKWYYRMPRGGILEIGPVSAFTPAEAVRAALRMYVAMLGKARDRTTLYLGRLPGRAEEGIAEDGEEIGC